MASAMMEKKSFMGTSLKSSRSAGVVSRPRVVSTQALFSKLRQQDKKEVERYKKSDTIQQKKGQPKKPKWLEKKPEKGFKLDAARNLRREGGFGAGEPFQKRKIGAKMEGTPIPSNIDPIFFVIGLSGFTLASVGFLILNQ